MLSVVRDQQTDLSAVEPPSAASSLRDGAVVFSGRRRLRVLVVDALPVVQAGVRRFLQDVPLILGVDEAETGEQAVGIARSLRPDVILLDPVPPDMLLKEAVRRLRAVSPESRIVIFTSRLTPSRRAEAISLGVSGILGKDVTPARLIEAIRSAKAGEFAEDPASSEILKQAAQRVNGTPLTAREYEIIQRAALGESNAEIAKAIFLAPTTVKSYLQSALRKLDARNRAEAVFKLSEMHIL